MGSSTDVVTSRGPQGRPPVGDRVAVRLTPDVLRDVDRRAHLLGRSRASVIRSLLGEALGTSRPPDDGVDRAQIRRALARSPHERIRYMNDVAEQQRRLRARGGRDVG